MKEIILLGSTGSIGRNVLDIVRKYPGKFRIKALSSNKNVGLLAEQAAEFSPETVIVGSEGLYPDFKKKYGKKVRLYAGDDALREVAGAEKADIVFMAISGTAALKPLVAAVLSGKTIALASKEPVVSAGSIIMELMRKSGSRVLPVDSEHSAIMQCLEGKDKSLVRTLYLTGSGGPFKDKRPESLEMVSVEEVLAHPKWRMGRKITVDSATLMNKGLEVIEARWLFDISPEKIKVIIHPEAVIHSMVEFIDGTIKASLFFPDMRFPILKALSFPEMVESDLPRLDFLSLKGFTFLGPDTARFPALGMAYAALAAGGTMPAVLNASNEVAVKLFLDGKIRFTEIIPKVERVLEKHSVVKTPSLDDIIESEDWAKEEVRKTC